MQYRGQLDVGAPRAVRCVDLMFGCQVIHGSVWSGPLNEAPLLHSRRVESAIMRSFCYCNLSCIYLC